MPKLILPAEPHADTHLDINFQRCEIAIAVATPGVRITLNAGITRTRKIPRPNVWSQRELPGVGRLVYQQRVQIARLGLPEVSAVKIEYCIRQEIAGWLV